MLVNLEDMKNHLKINNNPVTIQMTIDNTLKRITRGSGTFEASIIIGSKIKLAGFSNAGNNAVVTISAVVSPTVLEYAALAGVVDEVGGPLTNYRIEVTTYDTFLTEQLDLISEVVENYCGRKFLQANYRQTYYRKDFDNAMKKLFLYHFPVSAITSIEEDATAITDYRLHKDTGAIISDRYFISPADILEVEFTAGYAYASLPKGIQSAVKTIVEERFNKNKSGVSLNFGSDVQRISIPGTISIDFDYSLSNNERKSAFGSIIGSQANVLDFYRSERPLMGSSRVEFLETI
jgi:hypothetical protein